jgi:hypothetical protein
MAPREVVRAGGVAVVVAALRRERQKLGQRAKVVHLSEESFGME